MRALVPLIIALANAAQLTAQPGIHRTRSLRDLGFERGLLLDGPVARQTVGIRLPSPVPLLNARLDLHIRFSPDVSRQSNVEILANDVRLAIVSRGDSGATAGVAVRLAIPQPQLHGDVLLLTFRSSVAISDDVCRLGRARIEVLPESFLAFDVDPSSIRAVRDAWSAMPDTIHVALPSRTLSADEFALANRISRFVQQASRVIRYVTLPQPGELALGRRDEIAAATSVTTPPSSEGQLSLYRYGGQTTPHVGIALVSGVPNAAINLLSAEWTSLAGGSTLDVSRARMHWRDASNDPTFAELGIGDLERTVVDAAEWRIPLDLRAMPSGRMPSSVDLDLVAPPNTRGHETVLSALLNGTLVRTADMSESGETQSVHIALPSDLLITRNDLRIVISRQHATADTGRCWQDIPAIPANILTTSVVHTAQTDARVALFLSVGSALADTFPVYLPAAALERAAYFIPLVHSMHQALWGDAREPQFVFYKDSALAEPSGAFILVGKPARVALERPIETDSGRLQIRRRDTREMIVNMREIGQLTVAQVVRWNNHVGIQFTIAPSVATVPSVAEAYDRADVLIAFGDSTVHRLDTGRPGEQLTVNAGPSFLARFVNDRLWWGLFAVAVIASLVTWGIVFVRSRTPRRELRRPFTRSAREEPPQ
ncbi:MAG: cellulose biosynthesis cyclic di-GMP-binding regulatory protein BcsB [bacterium]